MPSLSKNVLNRYVRSECQRQFRLYLHARGTEGAAERAAHGMPDPQPPRPGLEYLAQAGGEWEADKLHDLAGTFGADALIAVPQLRPDGTAGFASQPLADALVHVRPHRFIVQADYEVGPTFKGSLGLRDDATPGLTFTRLRPDLVEVLPAGLLARAVTSAGEVVRLAADDARLQLRVIDIKLTAEASPGYFAEVTYYTMALAGWLVDQGLDGRFVVLADAALWPGSHEAANLTKVHAELTQLGGTPSHKELWAAMADDLEVVPFEVFAARVRDILTQDLPLVLSRPWRELDWHVDNRCKGCEWLGNMHWRNSDGEPTWHPDHCMPTAKRSDHLSRIAFVSRGASVALRDAGVPDVDTLARLRTDDPAFDTHHVLQATRTVVAGRATALQTSRAQLPPSSGTSALMPGWADLRIYLSVDFDIGSAITLAFGIKAFWVQPWRSRAGGPATTRAWPAEVLAVDKRDLEAEQRELLALLDRIAAVCNEARRRDADTTMQVYLWDRVEYEHLCRVVGRHLPAILAKRSIQHLAWLFPPDNVVGNAAMVVRRSPLTVVRDAVRALLAAPVPHYYTLLEIARRYHTDRLEERFADFHVHPLFEDTLSDQIPSERAHEIWSRSTKHSRHWVRQLAILDQAVRTRLRALEEVAGRLRDDLKGTLKQRAPTLRSDPIGPPGRSSRVSLDGQLWYAHALLNAAFAELEVRQTRAMPPHEREARFRAARLEQRLTGPAEAAALQALGLGPRPRRRVYRLAATSVQVRAKEGEFTWAMAPEGDPDFLDRALFQVVEGTRLDPDDGSRYRPMDKFTGVVIAGLDRDQRLIAVDPGGQQPEMLDELEAEGLADFSAQVMLDPVHREFFTDKLLAALQAIGNPACAVTRPLVALATAMTGRPRARRTADSPAADVLWRAGVLADSPVARRLDPARELLARQGLHLNASQWAAWQAALSRRLQLIWGPPGTGKSRTVRAVVTGAVVEACQTSRPLRVLVCAPTYPAMDNVLLKVHGDLEAMVPGSDVIVRRLRSAYRTLEADVDPLLDLKVEPGGEQVNDLRDRLEDGEGVTVVGAVPQQVHNLLKHSGGPDLAALFDLIVIDEASQMDVGHAILALCALAEGGALVVAGDHLQLAPIHQAEPPVGLEAMVGSVFQFFVTMHGLDKHMLTVNYRSNAAIVTFSLQAGYESTLTAHSPGLAMHLLDPLPTGVTPPPGWPGGLHWTPEWSVLLEPATPVCCFIYPEGRASQWNLFEADAVAALLWLLHGRLANRPKGEQDPTGAPLPPGGASYTPAEFFAHAVGVVTPHRAQQGLVVQRLQQVFPGTLVAPTALRDAVDTVERFQGQQRDLIVASFALGDPDVIRDEDEFLLQLNRFNVMASRARAKLIVLVSEEVARHLSADLDTLRGSGLLKAFVASYCRSPRPMTLGYRDAGAVRPVAGVFRHRP
jgi:DNA replication ATP-dependent helicase/nuclease Dna2